jgi:hypothetical protein
MLIYICLYDAHTCVFTYRRSFEYERGKELIEFTITDAGEEKRYDIFTRSLDRLDSSIMKLDITLTLLNNFTH